MYVLFDHDIRKIACTNLEYYAGGQGQVTLDQENYELCCDVISRCPFPYPLRFRIDNNHWDTMHVKCNVDGFRPNNGLVFTIHYDDNRTYDLVSIIEDAFERNSIHENCI